MVAALSTRNKENVVVQVLDNSTEANDKIIRAYNNRNNQYNQINYGAFKSYCLIIKVQGFRIVVSKLR